MRAKNYLADRSQVVTELSTETWDTWRTRKWASGTLGDNLDSGFARTLDDQSEEAELKRQHNFDDVISALKVQ